LGIASIDYGTYHEDDVVELISRQKELNFDPGEEYLYSNSGYFLLAVIVERASGKSLREYAEENIFKPLGMKNSHFHDDYRMLIKNRASGYFPAAKGKFRNFISTFDCVGSGGLFTSVEDLFLWDQNFYHHKVGGKELINLMHTKGKLNSGEELDYAFALGIGEYKGLKTVSHGGALGGYRSVLVRFPEQNFSVICLSNLSSFNPSRIAYQVADIYLADQFAEEKAKPEAKPAEKTKFIKLPRKKLQEKVGAYVDPKTGAYRRLGLRGNMLVLDRSGQRFTLAAVSETEFEVLKAPVEMVIKFEKQKKGKPMLMHVYREGEKSETYESFKQVKPTPEKLKEYEGDYYSDELQVTFRLALKEGKLN
ncbi:serine hydrolase, partial [bacterium]|nr:serine hydrolase [bacterium]